MTTSEPAWRSCSRPAKARACARRGRRCCTRSRAARCSAHVLAAVRAAGGTGDRGGGRPRPRRRRGRGARDRCRTRRCSCRPSGAAPRMRCWRREAAIAQGADDILVVFGDTPLIRPQTLDRLRAALADGAAVAVLGFRPADPTGYGRLVTSGDDLLAHPRADDASRAERAIALCNGGLMAFDGDVRADDSRAHRQRQPQGRILSDRRGGDRARHGSARRSRSK